MSGDREKADQHLAAGVRALYEKSRRTALDFNVPYAAAAARAKAVPGSGS